MRNLIFNYFNVNRKNFIILFILFFVGFILGILLINYTNDIQKEEITEYINTLRESIQNNKVDNTYLLLLSIKRNCKLILLLWLLGCTIIGGILVYFVIIYKGFLLGYTASSLIAVLGIRNGTIFAISSLFIQNLILIPAIFLIAESGIKLYKKIYTRCINLRQEVIRHTVIMFITIMLSIVSSFAEIYFSVNILMFFKEII